MVPLIIGGVVMLWVIAIAALILLNRRQSTVEERLSDFTRVRPVQTASVARDAGERTNFLAEFLNNLFARRTFYTNIQRDLARADLKFSVGEFMILHAVIFIGVGVVVGFLQQNLWIGIVFGLGSLLLPRIYVGNQQKGRLNRFDNQLGDMLNLVVNGLRAGYSVPQALEAVSRELPAPISVEFKRVVQEMQLGLPLEQALANLTRRIPSKDLDFVVTAINVQREVGGNLSEILDTISFTIRERVRIKGEIQTLTAQGMMTGYVISLLPIALGLFLFLLNRQYMLQFFVNPNTMQTDVPWTYCGIGMIILALMLIGGGFAIVMKIVDIEV